MIDRTTKIILALIAIGLFANVISPLVQPKIVSAADSFGCDGELKAKASGGTMGTIGGYNVSLSCR